MAANLAAGLLMCRKLEDGLEYFPVHPGGAFFKNKNESVWTISKGIPEGNQTLEIAAQGEFLEQIHFLDRAKKIQADADAREKKKTTRYPAWDHGGFLQT